MKQLAAILLLGVFTFNIFGYKLVVSFLESKSNGKMELAQDQNNYADHELISTKQPTNLSYYQNSKTHQRIDGEIEIEGVYYKYVKCRIYNDSLELLCIPNTGKMKILEAKVDFSKLASAFQQLANKKKNHPDTKSLQKLLSEFEEQGSLTHTLKGIPAILNNLLQNSLFVNIQFIKLVEQPPEPTLHNFLV